VLSISKFSSAPDPAAYYLEVIANGRDDYYLASGESPGRWIGAGAERLGLSGEVGPEALRAVLEGRASATGEPLVGWRKVQGFDLTLSAPKSVSLLWGLGDGRLAAETVAAHDAAVLAAVQYLEDEACVVRRGRAGATHLRGGGLVSAAFRHRTSREADPNLHTHLVTANMTIGPDGRWSALHTPDIYRHGRTAGFVYQAVLRHELAERLGVGFEPGARGVGEVVGMSKGLRRAFSRRRVAIESAMAEHGARSAHGAQVATLASRPDKPETVDEDVLRREWRQRAEDVGFTGSVPIGRPGPVCASDAELGLELTDQDATFDRRQVFRAVAETAIQGMRYETIRERVQAFLGGPEVVQVAPRCWTTPEMLALEAEALDRAMSSPRTLAVEPRTLVAAMRARPSISAEQALAVKRVTATDAPVAVIVGHAGTGKTFALDAAREAWHQTGMRVRGAALAARAARELQAGSGIPSQTIASLLSDLDTGRHRLYRTDVLVVDEAGMVGTRQLHRLIGHTSAAGAKLVLVGDPKQLAEIEAGGLFSSLARRLGHAELTENRRLTDRAQRATASALRDGHIDAALRRMDLSGSLTIGDNADRLHACIAEDWYASHVDGCDAVMLALHRSDVADLNQRARLHLIANDRLGPVVLESDDLELRIGDRVLALRNDRKVGVANGTLGTVTGASEDAVTIETSDGDFVAIPTAYVAAGNLTHGYAMTIHKSQGMTCDVALVLGDDTLHREAGYTSITRGRERNHVYAVAAPDPSGRPTEELRRALEVSTAKQTAHDRGGLSL
jgi:conjugative relaxase-like TrwC/TraI family protein